MFRRAAAQPPFARPGALAALVFLFAFGVYAFTTSPTLQGYEPETAATVDGLWRTGDFKIVQGSPLAQGGIPGKGGKLVGRVGLPQPLLESPFYLAGCAVDSIASGHDHYRWRKWTLLFYNPFVMALVAAALFLIVCRVRRSVGWALVLAPLFTLASIAWPYSKIGMDTTLTLGVALTFLGAVYARDSVRLWPWALVGVGGGLSVAAKAYALVAVLAVAPLLWPALKASSKSERIRRLAVLLAGFLLWIAAMGWYNWLREGSITKTGAAMYETTIAAPLNAIGFLASPGKGLVWYSPLVVLGIAGLITLWRRDRALAAAIAAAVLLLTAAVSVTIFWTDETWGPRYLVPVAWLLLLPIPWWATTRGRRRVLGAVTTVAVAVQLVAVTAPFGEIVPSAQALTGAPLYQERTHVKPVTAPFGDDSLRWIPQLSPLLIQGALVASEVGDAVGVGPITYTYAPYEGPPHSLRMSSAYRAKVGFGVPDIWWAQPDAGARGLFAVLWALLALAAAGALVAAGLGLRREDRRT